MAKELNEETPPGMEDWVKSNKQRFIDEYGKEKGLEVLYATAWRMHKEKNEETQLINAAVKYLSEAHSNLGPDEWKLITDIYNEFYKFVATTLKKEKDALAYNAGGLQAHAHICDALAIAFKKDNSQFNVSVFKTACGLR